LPEAEPTVLREQRSGSDRRDHGTGAATADDQAVGNALKLVHVFPTFAVGGAQVRFAALANALGLEFEHVVVSLDGAWGAERLVPSGVRLRPRPVGVRKGGRLSLAKLRTFRDLLHQERPDLLVTYNWGAIEWALADRLRPICPHLHVVDGFGPEEAQAQLRRRVWMRRLALSGHTEVAVPSRVLRALATTSWRLDPARVHHIPNGVDAADLDDQARRPFELYRQPGERLFGTLAGLRAEKNLGRLIRIASLLRKHVPWRLIIAGDGSVRATLEMRARALGLSERIVFTGFVDRPGALLGALDVFVLTSDTEQMPISVLEAMAVGLPVLSTDVGDLRTMLPADSRDTCLFARDDEAAFAGRLAALLASPDECRRLGALNRGKVADFRREAMVDRYDRLIRRLVAPG
jgi:glycosyltransferase involved in cell wall biosynthesis